MGKIYLIFFMWFSAITAAQENSNSHIDIKHKFTNQPTITWEDFEDVSEACKGITYNKTYGGKFIRNYGCAYWDREKNKKYGCLVFTKPNIEPHQFGILISHCYSGNVKK